MVHIFYIYADNCEHCQKVLMSIESAIGKCKKDCKLYKFKYDSSEAIALAVKKGVTDLPGVVIGNTVFIKDCTEKEIIEAIKKVE